MTHLDRKLVQKLAELSCIKCTQEEEDALLGDLENILSYFDQLNELDTNNVPPCNHILSSMSNVMRDDVVGKTLPRKTFLDNTPDRTPEGLVRVPPIITKTTLREEE